MMDVFHTSMFNVDTDTHFTNSSCREWSSKTQQSHTSEARAFAVHANSVIKFMLQFLNYLNGNADNMFTCTAKQICEDFGKQLPPQFSHLMNPPCRVQEPFEGVKKLIQACPQLKEKYIQNISNYSDEDSSL